MSQLADNVLVLTPVLAEECRDDGRHLFRIRQMYVMPALNYTLLEVGIVCLQQVKHLFVVLFLLEIGRLFGFDEQKGHFDLLCQVQNNLVRKIHSHRVLQSGVSREIIFFGIFQAFLDVSMQQIRTRFSTNRVVGCFVQFVYHFRIGVGWRFRLLLIAKISHHELGNGVRQSVDYIFRRRNLRL
ncbi:AAEL004510-PA [Aedes aegypti]|uniref:AAEL004510-PA n=1 Tax=Aedes aegypti TaxID=7159 RepID=Q0IFN7_AEDAE|nr:AAEL004510-PA [Aedes aegypti]